MAAMPGVQRDDLVRLRWVEDRIGKLAKRWAQDAAALRRPRRPDEAAVAAAAELEDCAAELVRVVAESRADGGPPADHLADAALHLAAFKAAARRAGRPVTGRLGDAIAVIESANAGCHGRRGRPDDQTSADLRQAGETIAAVRAAAARHLGGT